MKPLNILAFLLGLSLAFPLLSHATDYACEEMRWYNHSTTCNVVFNISNANVKPTDSAYGWEYGHYNGYAYWYGNTTAWKHAVWAVDCDPVATRRSCSEIKSGLVAAVYPSDDIMEPAYCSNGIQDGDETGINCGGSCGSVCISWCGGDYQLIDGICVASSLPDSFGNCASGFTPDPSGMCSAWKNPVQASEDYTPNDLTPFLTEHFNNTPVDNGTDIATVTVDNGDGTSTVTTTTTTTNNITNTSTTTTEVTNIDNSTGATISSTITTVGENPSEDNAGNYNYSVDYGASPVFDSDISADIPEKTEMSGIIDNFIDNFPLFSVLDNQSMSLNNTVCASPSVSIYGTDLTISLCRWEDFLKSLGVIFVIVAQSAAVFIVIRGWKVT